MNRRWFVRLNDIFVSYRHPSIEQKTLKQSFSYPVAFSDHTPGWDMDIAALALGANLVEKTITHDRLTRSVEHIFSIESVEISGSWSGFSVEDCSSSVPD